MGICHKADASEIGLWSNTPDYFFIRFIVSTSATSGLIFFKWAETVYVLGKICAFFGHRDVAYSIQLENKLKQEVIKLIEQGYDEFWLCDEGFFDNLSRVVMLELKEIYGSRIYLCYICAYNPNKFSKDKIKHLEARYEIDYPDVVYEGLQKYAIIRRNQYIADNVDAIICYITREYGGAYKAVKRAIKNNKTIINLADL